MNVITTLNQFSLDHIYFQESIKNTVMDNSDFIRIIYSNPLFMLNGIYLQINFDIIQIEKFFNKYKCLFNIEDNKEVIEKICLIEKYILEKVNIKNKKPHYCIMKQLMSGFIKIFVENPEKHSNYILKISGVWDSEEEYGITYKFIDINHP